MITFIEGPRNTGKSFLISSARSIKANKFDFMHVNDIYDVEEKQLGFFTLGYYYNVLKDDRNLIFDRGPISALVYGKLFHRFTHFEMEDTMRLYAPLLKNHRIVYVHGENPSTRNKKDDEKFDSLSYDSQDKTFRSMLDGLDVIYFENKFNHDSIREFKKIIYEY